MEAPPYPEKLKQDAILEAILEIRFESKEVPEIIIGRLTDYEPWREFTRFSTPFASIPTQIRMSNPDMRFKPLVDIKEEKGCRNIKIGPNIISFHNLKPYLGWDGFYKEISEIINSLFDKISGVSVRRIGLRYINALEKEKHFIESMSDLNLDVKINDENISTSFNFNYKSKPEENFNCLTRVATPDLVGGDLPKTTTAYIDIDVFTVENYSTTESKQVLDWVKKARHHKNEAFFKLLPQDVIEKIKEE